MFARSIFKAIFAMALAVGSTLTLADTDHAHDQGPHGGDVKTLGAKHHIEAVRKGAVVSLFVLDGEGKKEAAISNHNGVTVTVVAPGATQEKIELKAGQEFAKVEAKAPEKGKVMVLVSVKLDGKAKNVKFGFN